MAKHTVFHIGHPRAQLQGWLPLTLLCAALFILASCNREKLSTTDKGRAKGNDLAEEFRRANEYLKQGQKRTAEFYMKKVLEAEPTDTATMEIYCDAAASLANMLVNKGDYEGALRVAVPAVQKMGGESEYRIPLAVLLESIGRCQLNLGRIDEAAESYDQAYSCYMDNSNETNKTEGLRHAIIATHNTALSYLTAEHFKEVLFWTQRTDTLLRRYEAIANADPGFVGHVQARIFLHYAIALQGQGKTLQGSKAYRQYQATDYGKSADGRIDGTAYLMAAQRYVEAADSYRNLDSTLQSWGVSYSISNVERYLFPKYRANASAGRQDSAIAIGLQILDVLDSALVEMRTDDAAELATIYDTQRMETELARNQVKLTQQRLIATVAAAVLLTLFFFVYLLHRRRSQRQLALAHERLRKAYAEVESVNHQLEQKNVELTVATNRAEDALRIKSNFISEISHEIRTPLNILTGFTQIIIEQGHELDEAAKSDMSRQITENTERITELVDKMLELSEVSSKTTIETPDDVSARQIAEEAVKDSAITEASHLDFNLQFADDVDQLILHTNLQAATRVLTLLLDNARKFTRPAESVVDHGPIVEKAHVLLYVDTVVDHLHPETASSSNVVERRFTRFTVEDTGKGVPASEAERIFEKFVQLDDYYDGTGIGLTVARSLARSLGGDIVLDTTYTQGARFVMTIAVSPAGAK